MEEKIRNAMRSIPSMDRMLSMPWVAGYESEIGRDAVKSIISEVMDDQRAKILEDPDTAVDAGTIADESQKKLRARARRSLRPVVNATGVVLHTNLGRSLLAEEAVAAVKSVAERYSTLEYSPESGTRGQRNDHVEWLACRLTGAGAAIVVNNNAAAVILCLAALAKGKESIISRGELVEIGGSFRIPEIMALSGSRMVEVGATNMTHLHDYESAVTEETAVILKVHPSNFSIQGFSSSVPREDLSALARKKGVIFMEDLGSGMLTEMCVKRGGGDPTVRSCLEAGVDVVTFSGDKLLGGPQAGIIAGSAKIIDRLRKHPLLRAFRVDKMTLAALEATLRLYIKGDKTSIPTCRMLSRESDDMKRQAQRLKRKLLHLLEGTRLRSVFLDVVEVTDTVGGGSFPGSVLPGYAVSLKLPELGSAGKLAERLRMFEIPVIAGAGGDRVLLHVRTLFERDEKVILDGFKEMFQPKEKKCI